MSILSRVRALVRVLFRENARQEEKLALERQAVKDRIEDRKQYLEKLQTEKHIADEMKRWEMLNRIKTEEAIQEYNEQNRRDKWAKVLQYRKELQDQMVMSVLRGEVGTFDV